MSSSPVLVAGTSNPALAEGISKALKIPLAKTEFKRFKDGEQYVRIDEPLADKDVYIIQSTSKPYDDNLMQLYMLADAASHAQANRTTAVIPFFGYSRQDAVFQPGEAHTAALILRLLKSAGVQRILTVDIHKEKLLHQGGLPAENLLPSSLFADHIKSLHLKDIVVAAPDKGAVERAGAIADILQCGMSVLDKHRVKHNIVDSMTLTGDVKGKDIILPDDIMDTGGTIIKAAKVLKENGAKDIYICATHPVLSSDEYLDSGDLIRGFVFTDSIPLGGKRRSPKVAVVSLAPLIADAIDRVHGSWTGR